MLRELQRSVPRNCPTALACGIWSL